MRRSLIPILVLVVLGTGPASADPEAPAASARTLLERHIAWLGGREALQGLRDLQARGRLSAFGLEGSLKMAQRRDGYRRFDYEVGALRGTDCIAAQDAWVLNASGQIEPMGASKEDEERRALARSFGRHLLGEGVTVRALGPVEREGRTWEAIRFAYADGDAYDLLLDPSDGRNEWTRETRDTDTIWYRLEDWRLVAGVRYPFHEQVFRESAAEGQTIVWSEMRANTGLKPSLFARPADAARVAALAGGIAFSPWLPMDPERKECICLRGKVNGREMQVLLDSGAGITVLEQSLVERLGLRSEGALAAEGTTGSAPAGLVRGVMVEIGPMTVRNLTAASIDLSGIARGPEAPLQLILGKEVFQDLVVEVDYPNSRMRFHDPARFSYRGPGRAAALTPAEDGHRRVEMRVEGLPPAPVDLDTGSNGTLDLFRHYTDENGLLEGRAPVSERLVAGVGGAAISKVGTLRSVTLAGFRLEGVPVSFHRGGEGSFHTRRAAGNLGAGLLRRFRVIFDYPSDHLWLEPGEGWNAPFEKDRSGLQTVREGDLLRVLFVSPGSPAASSGWRAGERISAVDGRAAGGEDRAAPGDWGRRPAGTPVTLRMEDGTERILVLADYY